MVLYTHIYMTLISLMSLVSLVSLGAFKGFLGVCVPWRVPWIVLNIQVVTNPRDIRDIRDIKITHPGVQKTKGNDRCTNI